MKLGREEKDALAEYYDGKELYEPAKAKEQETSDFSPKCMCGGGHVMGMCHGGEANYAEGGEVFPPRDAKAGAPAPVGMAQGGDIDISTAGLNGLPNPFEVNSGASMTARGVNDASLLSPSTLAPEVLAPKPLMAQPSVVASAKPTATEQESPRMAAPEKKGLSDTEYQELMRELKPGMGQSLGQSAMAGLGGFADAIMSGVARAPGPGFQRNIMEMDQNKKANLIAALKEKYDAENRGTAISLDAERAKEQQRRDQAMEDIARQSKGAEQRLKEQELGEKEKENRLKAGEELAKMPPAGIAALLHPSTWGKGDVLAAQRARLAEQAGGAAVGPLGASTVRNGKTYVWSPQTQKYHPASK